MNCKQGDVAYYFTSEAGNYGRVVTCLCLANEDERRTLGFIRRDAVIWVTDRPTLWFLSGSKCLANDANLRPLRGDLTNDDVDTQINRGAETC